ncbi:hypothetical protein CY0110_19837 [Crocosphaera chwakensis CCY0110]|uniref:Uncharacterized protein n=2 Tax=Crocosphaera TaxID=263510 RepID=A3IJU9_9CHRO|nr:hypothetical protein CY0110_19837 [Crocosphaera chwakensis CCY0110]
MIRNYQKRDSHNLDQLIGYLKSCNLKKKFDDDLSIIEVNFTENL